MSKKNFLLILFGVILCIVLEYAVYNLNHKYEFFRPIFTRVDFESGEKHEDRGKFTNPLLECTSLKDIGSLGKLNISESGLKDLVSKITQSGKVKIISVYVRDLNNGPWFGVNEDEKFMGASLLKVSLMISYLKLVESDPSLFKKTIKYEKEIDNSIQYFSPLKEIEIGKIYTTEELLKYSIYYSDNNAADLLAQNIKESELINTFKALGFGEPDINNPYTVDVKTYAGFFRILFNASYLDRSYSEYALETLTHAEFNEGLTDKIPKDILVAHKFGIKSMDEINQLHDCGIVYYPKNPYLICVMTKGGKFDDLAYGISQVSKFVYDQVDKNL